VVDISKTECVDKTDRPLALNIRILD
jgi:hypothetical protein